MAVDKPIKQSWVPRGDGRGGTFTNSTYHDANPDSTQEIFGCVVDHNTWRGANTETQYGATYGPNFVSSMEIFNQYSGITQTISSNLIAGYTIGVSVNYVKNATTGVTIRSSGFGGVPTTGTGGAFIFQQVKNRMYMASGVDKPAIMQTVNSCIPWGYSPQSTPPVYNISAVTGPAGIAGGSTGNISAGGTTTINWTNGTNFEYCQNGQYVYIDTIGWRTVSSVTDVSHMVVNSAVGAGNYAYSYAPTGMVGVCGVTNGSAVVTFVSGISWNLSGTPVVAGQTIFIKNVPYTIATVAASITLTVNYAGTTDGAAAYQCNIGPISTTVGTSSGVYTYAVSYYNPTSGHVTNTSPTVTVKDGAPSNQGVTITLSGIITNADSNYTKIILWRSLRNSTLMYPVVLLNNYFGNNFITGTITYTDTIGDDNNLGTAVGGPGKIPAPPYGNNGPNQKPPDDLNHIAYWNGRFWGSSQTNIGILYYSCRSFGLTGETPIGVPEECWPIDHTRTVPESDGRITGLRTVGENLFILTDNNIYAVYGNDSSNYTLVRQAAKGHGTTQLRTALLPGEDANSSDVLVHFGNDNRGYFLFGSGGDFQFTYPIQDKLTSPTFVGVQHTQTSSYVIAGTSIFIYSYDLERKIWSRKKLADNYGSYAYVEGLFGGTLTQFYGSANTGGAIFKTEVQSGTPPLFYVVTNYVSPGGKDRNDDKTLQAVIVYYSVGSRSDSMQVFAGIDIAPGFSGPLVTLTEVSDAGAYGAYFETIASGASNVDARLFVPQGSMARGRIFQITAQVQPSVYGAYISEIVAIWSHSQDETAPGGNV